MVKYNKYLYNVEFYENDIFFMIFFKIYNKRYKKISTVYILIIDLMVILSKTFFHNKKNHLLYFYKDSQTIY